MAPIWSSTRRFGLRHHCLPTTSLGVIHSNPTSNARDCAPSPAASLVYVEEEDRHDLDAAAPFYARRPVRSNDDGTGSAPSRVGQISWRAPAADDREETYCPSEEFKDLFEECFAEAEGHDALPFFHRQAVRIAVQSDDIELVRYLLEKDATKSLLAEDSNSVQTILCVHDDSTTRNQDPVPMIKLLLKFGAQVNGLDEAGNTALYYATAFGLPDTFRFLLDNGADFTPKHHLPAKVKGASRHNLPKASSRPTLQSQAVDLMQVALHSSDSSTLVQNSVLEAYKCWAPIIVFFIDAHFSHPLPENIFTELTEAACSVADMEIVSKLLSYQSNVSASGLLASSLAPGLKSATREGHLEITRLLLRFGADPRLACESTRQPGRRARCKQPEQSGEEIHKTWKTAIEDVCERNLRPEVPSKPLSVLDACEVLFWEGISEADQHLLLAEAALQGRIDIVQRLWAAGVRLKQAPITGSVPVLEFFIAQGTSFNWPELQKYAIPSCRLHTIDWLVGRAGQHLKSRQELEPLLKVLMGRYSTYRRGWLSPDMIQRRKSMLAYLFTSYAHPKRTTVKAHAEVNMLVLRAVMGRLHDLKLFLQEGTRSHCPGLRSAAMVEIKAKAQSDDKSGSLNYDGLETVVKELQLLLRCYDGELSETQTLDNKDDRLWLTPSMLDAWLEDGVAPIEGYRTEDGCRTESHSCDVRQRVQLPHRYRDAPVDKSWRGQALEEGENGDMPEDATPAKASTSQIPANPITDVCSIEEVEASLDRNEEEPSEDSNAPIECTIRDIHLAEKPTYEALSYVWGHGNDSAAIQLNNKTRLVRSNLRAALFQLRFRKHPRVLWIDALCINQGDVDERNHQVRIMSTIYQSAKRVLIWVGESGDGSKLVFDYMRKLRTKHKQDPYRDEPDDEGAEQPPFNFSYAKGRPTLQGELGEAFEKFCHRPWFSKTWVIQEFALSSPAVVVCGGDKEQWSLLQEVYPGSRLGKLNAIRTGVRGDPFLGGRRRGHAAESVFGPSKAQSILDYSIQCEATEPRDRVYALLGILPFPSIKVDYKLPVEEVYRSFSQAIFEQTRKIGLLHRFGFERNLGDLPSWVLDLSASTRTGMLPQNRGVPAARDDEVRDLLSHAMDGFRTEGSAMFIRGSLIDHIHEVAQVLPPLDHPDVVAPTDSELKSVIRSWESCACRIKTPNFLAAVPAVFVQTLEAHDGTLNRHLEPVKYPWSFWDSCAFFGFTEFKRTFPKILPRFRPFALLGGEAAPSLFTYS
ncbi:hypothetical protein M409DRAFT_50983 [Zasmidium cellare ATCC 36951]|uniref:Heterokaryon incompatibility domain-containing protein n=1 Tax=Zasmidium cellare ATCC 36951 TaxID=1080233 RepID=A0A6A6CWJ5_ZASCE|nr:uncharacterized protein M409DRAFT_50983 [Zasmidium cellare ATCC 36951]KAF2171567.1 hypothetical protein M409DRAFT_50983 [Zasmidium cellare ATCC 36951]